MDTPSERKRESGPGQSGKRTYEPPQILSQQVFETTALACGKLPGGGAPCSGGNRRTS
jgi:hypothetical protein